MVLDPIVSLSVALAEAPGTCAFFLGSGVSRDAGVPTGYEVMREGLRRLHRIETATTDQLTDEQLDEWLRETERDHLTYSDLLELIAPDQAVRREYLAGFFEGAEPGPTHEALAGMAERGLVRVFVTTNFDRLLEHALQARGIEPVVIASDADLAAAMPREHASCVVLKPHGDYLRETIRNTPEELAELEPGITGELVEVFCRYGVVVVGYSGGDEAIGRALRARRSRFGVWWVSRGELAAPAGELVEAVAGRVIVRDSAAEFLSDLERRLAVWDQHPSGMTPAAVHDGTLAMLRAGDMIGLADELRREQVRYEREIDQLTASALSSIGTPTHEALRALWTDVLPVLERRLASLLPLALYAPETFTVETHALARMLERQPARSGLTLLAHLPEWCATWLGYLVGALLVRLERFDCLAPLLRTTWTNSNGYTEPLVFLPGEASNHIGEAMTPHPSGQSWIAPAFEYLSRAIDGMHWLEERYPELYVEGELRKSLAAFDMLLVIGHGLLERRTAAFFLLGSDAVSSLALRLHRDEALRSQIATAFGVDLATFESQAPEHLRAAQGFQGLFTSAGTIANLLQHGNASPPTAGSS